MGILLFTNSFIHELNWFNQVDKFGQPLIFLPPQSSTYHINWRTSL